MQKKKSKDLYEFAPVFRPDHIEVILDEGVEKMRGNHVRLLIKDIQYDANFMRIIVDDYGRK